MEALDSLESILESGSVRRWKKVEKFVCEYSFRSIPFEMGRDFIERVRRGLKRKVKKECDNYTEA